MIGFILVIVPGGAACVGNYWFCKVIIQGGIMNYRFARKLELKLKLFLDLADNVWLQKSELKF